MSAYSWLRGLVSSGAGRRTPGTQNGESGAFPSRSAVPVTQDTALCFSAFWACVKLISESVASMPLQFYATNKDGTRTVDTTNSLAILMKGKVNRYQTRFGFFETMTMMLCTHGNAYALRQKNGQGTLIGLLPLMASQMTVTLEVGGGILYQYNDGRTTTKYTENEIWHIRLMGNGIVGLSPLSYARNSIGVGLAAENSMGKLFGSGSKPAAALTVPHVLKPDQRAKIKENFREMVDGNDDTLFLLEADMKYQQISMIPKDVELLASRSFQTKDVCRFMGVPSVLVNDTDASTAWGSGIEQIVSGFYKFGLRPYLERFEAAIIIDLLPPEQRMKMECEFDFNALLRADQQKRFQALKEGITGGFITPNEARLEEGMVALPGGENLFMQQQMVPVSMLANGDGLKVQPKAATQ